MNTNQLKSTLCTGLFVLLILLSCSNDSSKKEAKEEAKKDTAEKTASKKEEEKEEPKRPPIINITDTLSEKKLVLYIKDSAKTMDRISLKLGEIYGIKLAAVIKKNKLKTTGQPMAWHTEMKGPYFFEAGIPVDKKPSKLPAGILTRQIGVDSVTVAHFHGPYEMLPAAYDAVKDYLKDRKKKPSALPYEIYVDDPMDKDGKMKDPYKVQTDIVFPWK